MHFGKLQFRFVEIQVAMSPKKLRRSIYLYLPPFRARKAVMFVFFGKRDKNVFPSLEILSQTDRNEKPPREKHEVVAAVFASTTTSLTFAPLPREGGREKIIKCVYIYVGENGVSNLPPTGRDPSLSPFPSISRHFCK